MVLDIQPLDTRFQGKVFGVGLPKTATTSLEEAFVYLGYKKLGYSGEHLDQFLTSGLNASMRAAIDAHDAFADWPWNLCFRQLFFEYGTDAKFVLTKRKSDEVWLNSVLKSSLYADMTSVRRRVYGVDMPHAHQGFLVEHYNRHLQQVRDFFVSQGAEDQLLELEIGSPGSWEAFCNFLGVANDERGFTRQNDTSDRVLEHRILYKNLKILNASQRGVDRPALLYSEAALETDAPQWRTDESTDKIAFWNRTGAVVADALRGKSKTRSIRGKLSRKQIRHATRNRPTSMLPGPLREIRDLKDYAADCIATIHEKQLFGIGEPDRPGYGKGIRELGDQLEDTLVQVLGKYVANFGVLPNLLFPRTFGEFNILSKFFSPLPRGLLEDKIRSEGLIPDDVQGLLTPHARPYVSDQPEMGRDTFIPDGRYLWKANFGCGFNHHIETPIDDAQRENLTGLAQEWFAASDNTAEGQWWTKYVDRKVYLERALGPVGHDPLDWKFFVFGGRVELVQVDSGRHTDHSQSAYDRNFNRLKHQVFAPAGPDITKPTRYADMVKVAEGIGRAFDFMRVDLYSEDDEIYIGELARIPNAGFKPFRSQELEFELGKKWPQNSILRQDLDWHQHRITQTKDMDRLGAATE